MKKGLGIFAVVGILILTIGVVAAGVGATSSYSSPGRVVEPPNTSEATIVVTAIPDFGITVTASNTYLIDELDGEGQGYITQEDGTITIFLK